MTDWFILSSRKCYGSAEKFCRFIKSSIVSFRFLLNVVATVCIQHLQACFRGATNNIIAGLYASQPQSCYVDCCKYPCDHRYDCTIIYSFDICIFMGAYMNNSNRLLLAGSSGA